MSDLHLDFIDYKKIFKDRERRLNLISRLHIIPTPLYLKVVYWVKTGHCLHLRHPKSFSEKLNWLKLHDIHPEYTHYVDKLWMKQFITENYGAEYVIPLLGAWEKFEDIDFDTLPNAFVLKCSHDSASARIVKDKSKIDKQEFCRFYNNRLKLDVFSIGREYPYRDVPPRIIAEEYREADDGAPIRDYKFLCFAGEVKAFYVLSGRNKDERQTWFYPDKTLMDGIVDPTAPIAHNHIDLPGCIDDMLKMAEELAAGIKFVRVDLYEDQGKFYFGEMTFFHCGGFVRFTPEEWEYKMGAMLHLENE